ncbi:MAG: trp RNA-binding attenuation protein MtrB [Clostridia bacterium]|nr:trp RNA-binding attenuation protein MtrB [Clostridia bacterium]
MDITSEVMGSEYIAVKSEASNVQVIGMTRGSDTRPHHTEVLDKGEVLIMQFTDKTSLIKIKGNAKVYTKFGIIESEKQNKETK